MRLPLKDILLLGWITFSAAAFNVQLILYTAGKYIEPLLKKK